MNLNTSIIFINNFFCCDFKQVERVFGASHPDPLEIEKAKKVLKVRSAVSVVYVVVSTSIPWSLSQQTNAFTTDVLPTDPLFGIVYLELTVQ